ncbi:MAG: hypothetical protein LBG76_07410 [Treponema sp.]|jgi:hypothetical protein|nr:hypothetical protein [Treponema sp.]
MVRKCVIAVMAAAFVFASAGCQKQGGVSWVYNWDSNSIAAWGPMATPGGGEGSVSRGGGAAIVHAAADGWGGVQSGKISLDLSKDPVLLVQVRENADGFKWGAKFVPANPAVDDHAWGFYLIEDNNFKWNNYAGTDMKLKLGQDFTGLYGEKFEGVLWIYAAGSPDATVEITSVRIFNQK